MPESWLAGRRILVVEDEYYIAEDMRDAFEAAGAEVIGPASCVADALGLLRQTPGLDAAVLDINLRGEMGYPVADALISRGVRFVFVTGYGTRYIPARYGQFTCYEKPVAPREIAGALFA